MSRLVHLYFTVTALSLAMLAFPMVGVLLAVPTLGLAALLPTLWVYATVAGLPAWALRRWGVPKRTSLAIGAAIAAAVALIPANIADKQAEEAVQSLTAGDLAERQIPMPAAVELASPRVLSRPGDGPLGDAACGAVCQRLLLSGQVRSVSVRPAEGARDARTVTYEREARVRCPAIFINIADALPSTIRANVAGTCIVPRIGVSMTDGVVIVEDDLGGSFVPTPALTDLKDSRRLMIAVRRGGRDTIVTRITHVGLSKAAAPLTVGAYFSFLSSVHGVSAGKVHGQVNDYDYFGVLQRTMGLMLAPSGKTISAGADPNILLDTWERPFKAGNGLIRTILDKPGAARFEPELEVAVLQWAEPFAWQQTPDEEFLRLLDRLLRDPRFHTFRYVTQTLEVRRELVPRFADTLLERLRIPGSSRDQAERRRLAVLLAAQPDEDAGIWRGQALEILKAELSPATSPLLKVAARGPVPQLPDLLHAFDASEPTIVEDAIRAACAANPTLASKLVPALSIFVADDRGYAASAIVGIGKLRGRPTAEALAGELFERKKSLMLDALSQHTAEDGSIECPVSTNAY